MKEDYLKKYMPFSCVLDIDPSKIRTAQQKGCMVRNGKPFFFTKKAQQDSNNLIIAHINRAIEHEKRENNFNKFDKGVPIYVSVTFAFKHKKNEMKKCFGKNACHTQRPDVDNLAKGVIDSMQKCGIFHDDSQITSLYLHKFRNNFPHISIMVMEDITER